MVNHVNRIFASFFICFNAGAFLAFSTTVVEQRYGFSKAFALPGAVFLIGFIIVCVSKNNYVSRKPQTSLVLHAIRAISIAIWHGGSFEHARVSEDDDDERRFPWDNSFIDELTQALRACKLFIFYPFYWAAYNQFFTNFISQAATMNTHGIPNDMMTYLNPISGIIFVTFYDRILFPWLRKHGYKITNRTRVMTGFMLIGCAMLYASFVQWIIYGAAPCYDHPRSLDCKGGKVPNQVSILVQIPAYLLISMSEMLAVVAGLEYAYTEAPASMKSLIMAAFLSMIAFGSFIAVLYTPLTVDPKLPWMYLSLGVQTLIAGSLLVIASRKGLL